MEDGTWNKAYCFVFITCTMGSVGGYRGVVNRQTRDPCLQGGESEGGNHAGQADAREGGEGPRPSSFIFHRKLRRRGGRLDHTREGSGGGRGCRKS
jgi:hypothetical protein